MRVVKIFGRLALAGLAAGAALGVSTSAGAEERVSWKMQVAFPTKLPIIGEAVGRFEGLVETMSGGSLRIKAYEPNALVPPLEGFDTVKAGSIDAMWGASAYHAGKIPALTWFTAVPFGPRAGAYLAWLR